MRVSRTDRVATVPNALSLLRILLIPVFVALILRHGDEEAGLALLVGVVATGTPPSIIRGGVSTDRRQKAIVCPTLR